VPNKDNNVVTDDEWNEILDEVNYDYIPIEYVSTVIVTFLDEKVWEIDVQNKKNGDDPADVIGEFLEEYDDTIDTVDFRLDTKRLKKDINKRTKRFLKLNK
jgi:hypothetical protein